MDGMSPRVDGAGEPLPLEQLPAFFREEAERASPYSRNAARVWRWAADAIERSLAARLEEVLSISAASTESGWSYEALRRRVTGEPALNAGTARRAGDPPARPAASGRAARPAPSEPPAAHCSGSGLDHSGW